MAFRLKNECRAPLKVNLIFCIFFNVVINRQNSKILKFSPIRPKSELPTYIVLFINVHTVWKFQLAACSRKCHRTNIFAHFQVLAGRRQGEQFYVSNEGPSSGEVIIIVARWWAFARNVEVLLVFFGQLYPYQSAAFRKQNYLEYIVVYEPKHTDY